MEGVELLIKLSDTLNADSFLTGNILYRKVNNEWIGKPGIQVKPNGKGFQTKWQENILPTDVVC